MVHTAILELSTIPWHSNIVDAVVQQMKDAAETRKDKLWFRQYPYNENSDAIVDSIFQNRFTALSLVYPSRTPSIVN
jgi:hypothetical protein